MSKPLDLKSTLNLPRTDFPMKAKLPEREPLQLAEWEKMGIYERILASREGAPLFVLHDGPPYPTGDIHLGTGLNKICKDLVVKSKTMAGFRSPYIPGWDCHGLPIESKVEKDLGGRKDKVSPAEFRRLCREYATKYVDSNRRDFKQLGIFGQWSKPYLTMDPHHEASIADAFITFLEKGYVYRGLKPVYWCFVDRTSLAEADRQLILATLEQSGGVKTRAAEILGISLKTLYNRLVEYGDDVKGADSEASVAGNADATGR